MPQQQKYGRLPPSGIKVIIVGAGFAGLTAAIELDRHGHHAILLEKVKKLKPLGDVISFSSNSGHIFTRWEGIEAQLDPIIHKSDHIEFLDWHGNYITSQYWDKEEGYGQKFNGHRGEIHEIVFNHAQARGIDIRLGQDVTEYFEDGSSAGVISNGERLTADLVLAAEGVKSPGRRIVLGHEDAPRASGYAIYRAWMPSAPLADLPRTAHLVNNGDTHRGWIGPDVHFLTASIKDGADFSWVLTHKDAADIAESWQYPGKVSDVLSCLEGWDPTTHDIVKATPEDRLVDYKLVYRDPLPTFISPHARVALIGDAAHPFLPTSIQGASQAMEDGAVLAVCLELIANAGGDIPDVQLAVRAYERIRYGRVCRAQGTGVSTREQWHKADWEAIRRDPESLHLKREAWLLDFDAESDAYERFEGVVEELVRECGAGEGRGRRRPGVVLDLEEDGIKEKTGKEGGVDGKSGMHKRVVQEVDALA